ncbi:hypothetical protein JCM15519_07610 [Fundidesulfovibrio butyratiphilus]
MANPRLLRWVSAVPKVTYFKPQGVPLDSLAEITLCVEELEALRLADMLGLTAEEAAVGMGVSRHTFGRILAEARARVARALVTGMALRIEGGHYEVSPAGGHAAEDLTPERRQANSACERAVRNVQTMEEASMRRGDGTQCGRGGGGGQGRCGQGQGRSQGQGQGGRGGGSCGQGRGFARGKSEGASSDDSTFSQVDSGMCQCPQCGRTAPHKPGSPCADMRCPDCGVAMVRQ